MFKGKKAVVDDVVDLLVMTLVIVFGIALVSFMLFFSLAANNQGSEILVETMDTQQILLGYLQHSAYVEGEWTPLKQVLFEAVEKQEFTQFAQATQDFFGPKSLRYQLLIYKEDVFSKATLDAAPVEGFSDLLFLGGVDTRSLTLSDFGKPFYSLENQGDFSFDEIYSFAVIADGLTDEALIIVLYTQ